MSSVIDYKLPSDWSESELDKLIAKNTKITYGVVQPGPKDPDGVPFIRGGDIFNGKIAISKLRTISTEVSNAYKRTLLKGGELLMSLVGYPGEVAIVPSILAGANIARQAAYIKLGDTVDDKYVMHYLRSEIGKYYLFQKSTGSAQQVINLVDLKEVTILLPPLPEQQKIAAILSSVDEVIEKTQAQINKLKDLKTGMMQELLSPREGQAANIHITQGESKNGLHHTEFKDSPLGRIPVGWEVVTLNQVSKVIDCKHATPKYFNDGFAVVKPGNIKEGNLDLTGCAMTNKDGFENLNENHKPVVGDTIYSRNQTYGIGAYVFKEMEFAIGQDVCIIHPKACLPKYLFYAVNAPIVKHQVELLAAGSTFKRINLGAIRQLLIPVPSQVEQKIIENTLVSIDEKANSITKKLTSLKSIKKALMQDLLTGKVRVKLS
jgi:type I restriction enzyme S subunit